MANTNITSNITAGPRLQHSSFQDEEKKKPKKKKPDFPLRQEEIDAENRRVQAKKQKQKPPKKKVKPANWEQMLTDRPKTPLTPEEYFEKIR
jgi:hypothetical protein